MKAIVQNVYGSADVLELREVEKPTPGKTRVRLRVHAAGVDQGVWHLMAGLPYIVRLFGYGFRRPRIPTPGMDVAGTVEAVGPEVTRWKVGDEVFGTGDGTFAEYCVADEDKLAPRPSNLTMAQAAVVATSGLTALQAVRDHGKVQRGHKVLVIGAAGGVGSYAVQAAKALGAEVTGVSSTAKVDVVRSLGADDVIDYTREEITDAGVRYDAIVDTAGGRPLTVLRAALARRGTLVIVGAEGGDRWIGGTHRQIFAGLINPFADQTLTSFVADENHEDLIVLKGMIEAGQITPLIDRTWPLAEAPDAIAHIAAGRAAGKNVVTVGTFSKPR